MGCSVHQVIHSPAFTSSDPLPHHQDHLRQLTPALASSSVVADEEEWGFFALHEDSHEYPPPSALFPDKFRHAVPTPPVSPRGVSF